MTELLDVLIVGGGPVGACAGALLVNGQRRGADPLRVVVLEPRQPEAPPEGSPLDSRVVAISRASERVVTSTGAWSRMPGRRIAAYERMCIWHETVSSSSDSALVFDAAEAGEPNLGYILENRLLQVALLEAFAGAGGRIESAELRGLRVGADSVHVETTTGSLEARLVIGADGAQSAVREA